MDRTASRLRDAARLALIGAIALLLALSRTSIATANSDLVLICHGTGSDSNEIVIIRVDSSGMNGHEIEEIAKTYDCQPAGGSGGGTSGGTDPGSGDTGSGGSGGTAVDGGGGGSTGTGTSGTGGSGSSGGSTAGSGSTSGGSGPTVTRPAAGGQGGPTVVGSAGIGPVAAEATPGPQGLTLAVGGMQVAVPMTDTVARFLARSSTGQQLGVGLTAIAGIGFLLLLLFGSLARRRA